MFQKGKGGFSFFSQEGWENFRWGASHIQYAILDASGGACNGKPKCARGVKRHSSGVKHFLKGDEKNLGGVTSPNPPPAENLPMQKGRSWCIRSNFKM